MPSPSPVVVFRRPAARLARRESERPVDDVSALPGPAEQYSPLVGRDMRAELIGEGFNVVAHSPASQTLSLGGTTTWDWEVTPLHGANYALTIKTSVEGVMANGQRVVLGSTTRTRRVRVKVLWYDTMQDDLAAIPLWIKLVLGIVVPLTALIWAVRKLVAAIGGRGKPPDTSNK